MTAMLQKQSRLDGLLGRIRWLAPVALLALAPKCILCGLAYAGLATALVHGGPQLCGAANNPVRHGIAWLLVAALGGAVGFIARRKRRSPAG